MNYTPRPASGPPLFLEGVLNRVYFHKVPSNKRGFRGVYSPVKARGIVTKIAASMPAKIMPIFPAKQHRIERE